MPTTIPATATSALVTASVTTGTGIPVFGGSATYTNPDVIGITARTSPTGFDLSDVAPYSSNTNTYWTQSGAVSRGTTTVTLADGTVLTLANNAAYATDNNPNTIRLVTYEAIYAERNLSTNALTGNQIKATIFGIHNVNTRQGSIELANMISLHGNIVSFQMSGAATGSSPPYYPSSLSQPVACFVAGTKIKTPDGLVAIEEISEGDLVCTMDAGAQPVSWIGETRVMLAGRPEDRPIVFAAGSVLGNDTPISFSPNHRVLVTGHWAELLFGETEVLVAAKHLVNDHNVRIDYAAQEVRYFHLMFDHHHIVFSEGDVASESYFVRAPARNSADAETRSEVTRLFPELAGRSLKNGQTARMVLKRAEARLLMQLAS